MSQQYTMKIQEYHEKRAKYDPIAWSKCNICKEKYPNNEIVSHIHQKHPEKDCSLAGHEGSSSEKKHR